jgi:F-type H+-transporting ATPase subunit g
VTYNLAVARAFLRQVYIAEGLAPPTSVEAFTTTYRTLFERAKNPAYWREIAQSGEWAKVALYGVEAYGIFHIGEMSKSRTSALLGHKVLTVGLCLVGRRHIVGYKLN